MYLLEDGIKETIIRINRILSGTERPVVVGIGGGSGSGKTKMVAEKIRETFPDSVILSMDDYIRGIEYMRSINSKNWDEPRVYELELLIEHLRILKKSLSVQKPIYDFTEGRRRGYETFAPKKLIILEGIFTLHWQIVDSLDFKVFVEVSVHGSLIRRITRDIKRTGKSEQEIFSQFVQTVHPMYKLHIEPTKSMADIIILNRYVPEVEAENCREKETQVKVFLPSAFSTANLSDRGFKRMKTVMQRDVYYGAPDWQEGYFEETMRIRQENGHHFLSYKGPGAEGELSIKPMMEFEVDESMQEALLKLGYKEIVSIVKKRDIYVGNSLELVLDELTNGPWCLEIRSDKIGDENKIFKCLNDLGISREGITKKSYLEIMFNKCIL